jgi:hypothetical protein
MTSENQIDVNGKNAINSNTAHTDISQKNRSGLNALRDLLSGQVTVMTEEDRVAHDKFAAALVNDLAPSGAMETQLAQRVATDSWRLNRLYRCCPGRGPSLCGTRSKSNSSLFTSRGSTAPFRKIWLSSSLFRKRGKPKRSNRPRPNRRRSIVLPARQTWPTSTPVL